MLVLSLRENGIEENFKKAEQYRDMFDLIEVRIKEAIPRYRLPESMPLYLTITDVGVLEKWSWDISPTIVDLPFESSSESLKRVRELFPNAILQGSSHLEQEASDFEILSRATLSKGFDSVKIVCHASSLMASLSLFEFLHNNCSKMRLTCFPIGEKVQYGRIIAAALGSFCSFCSLPSQPVAPGQLDIETFHTLYGGKEISKNTTLYGLIGNPVEKSLSHITHTRLFRSFGLDAVYVKIPVNIGEAQEVVERLLSLGFRGLSVTTPLKRYWGNTPINTLRRRKNNIDFLNSDGKALVDAVKIKGPFKSALILGAGAVALSVAQELSTLGIQLFFHNRTREGAERLLKMYDGKVVDLEKIQQVDVVVNATSSPDFFIPLRGLGVKLVCEFIYPETSALLRLAQKLNISVVTGTELWVRQAAKQFHFWCGFDENRVVKYLQESLSCPV